MPIHPDTAKSYSEKSDQYIHGDCTDPPLCEAPYIRELLGDVSGKTVLCAGCGTGAECAAFLARGATVEGIDTSQALLDIAKSRCPGLSFTLTSIEKLPSADGTFDIVYCAHVLHYLDDWHEPLKELHRVLASGGKMLITLHHPAHVGHSGDEPKAIHAKWWDDFEVVIYPRSIKAMCRTFEDVGLQVLRTVEVPGETGQPPRMLVFALGRAG